MEKAKVIKRIKNLEKIKGIIEIAKFDVIQKLSKTSAVKDHHFEMAKETQMVLSYIKKKYHLSNVLLKNKKITNKHMPTIWVFITIPSILIKTSYAKWEAMIVDGFHMKEDGIITIGEDAKNFASKKNLNEIAYFDNYMDSAEKITSLVNEAIVGNKYEQVKIVAKVPEINSEPYKLFPISSYPKEDLVKYKKTHFHHSLSAIIHNISYSYVANTIEGIYQESKRFLYKEKLVKHEGSLENIDARMQQLKRQLQKHKRKKDTEEMIQVSRKVGELNE